MMVFELVTSYDEGKSQPLLRLLVLDSLCHSFDEHLKTFVRFLPISPKYHGVGCVTASDKIVEAKSRFLLCTFDFDVRVSGTHKVFICFLGCRFVETWRW